MSASDSAVTRWRIRVEGIVQGVGFRPFAFALAKEYAVSGFVGNDATGVFIEAEAPEKVLAEFAQALRGRAPALAVVEDVNSQPIPATGERGFRIIASDDSGDRHALVSPDIATCDVCLAELFDPADRRFRYPFINCTNCGPRFTIVRSVPYDRPNTTMASFRMCAPCRYEYDDPLDRRFHAQPTCCPACGPRLVLLDADGHDIAGEPVAETVRRLQQGSVVAIKGLGGYHLAADADCQAAVAALRSRKHREERPFALMAVDVAAARELGDVDEDEAALLAGSRRPIVLLRRRAHARVAESVAPGNRWLGVMLPYTPLHHLLARELGRPFVLTSGNVSDEPIAYVDEEARHRLSGIADVFLTHDRPIHMRTDDSVVRVFRAGQLPLRRSRGYVPEPLRVGWEFRRPVLAVGAELKNTFCLGKGRHAFVSHHVGDLENYETLRSFTTGIEHFCRLFDARPEVVAHDLHPEYLSTKYALDLDDVRLVGVQHHHAHIASCLADNGETGTAIGVAFDGLGFGTDGTIWGGEVLLGDLGGFERVGHLAPVPLPGGAAAIRQPWRMAAAYLHLLFGEDVPALDVVTRHEADWADVVAVARSGVATPLTSSAGRLFDAVAALLGVRDSVTYEGQAAIELEQRVDLSEPGAYAARIDDKLVVHGEDFIRSAVDDLRRGLGVAQIAARFHRGLAAALVDAVDQVRDRTGVTTVALSGGVFQNVVLLTHCVADLEAKGFQVLTHTRVPPNDGGISLGQAAVAAATAFAD